MEQFSTQDKLLLLAYNELTPQEEIEFSREVAASPDLQKQYAEIILMKKELGELNLIPTEKSVDNILTKLELDELALR